MASLRGGEDGVDVLPEPAELVARGDEVTAGCEEDGQERMDGVGFAKESGGDAGHGGYEGDAMALWLWCSFFFPLSTAQEK